MDKRYSYKDLVDIVARLRGKDGCPWDIKQTHESLLPNLLEETYEVIDAISNKDPESMKEELGDLLLQVIFHANIAAETDSFTIDDVADRVATKLVYRHPHIFQDQVNHYTADDVLVNWEKLKKKEKQMSTQTEVIESVPKVLPALMRAYKVQKKASDVGFDWDDYKPMLDKLYEEISEFEQAINSHELDKIEEELGDILFTIVNIGRFFKINPEFALTKCVEKFINRFRYIEKSALSQGKQLESMTLQELDKLWEDAKQV